MNELKRGFTVLIIVACALSASAEKVHLGKLGQALQRTPIYSRASESSRIYYRLKPFEYVVVNTSPTSRYLKVLMGNGSVGYVATAAVARLPYDVSVDRSTQKPVAGLSSNSNRQAIADYSLKFTGTPYKWGGNDPTKGIDCSGFVKFLYGQIGVSLPRTAAEQVRVGSPITKFEDLLPGDRLYFWSKKKSKVGHTGIYLGNGYFCHSSTSNGGVATDHLGKATWRNSLVAARR